MVSTASGGARSPPPKFVTCNASDPLQLFQSTASLSSTQQYNQISPWSGVSQTYTMIDFRDQDLIAKLASAFQLAVGVKAGAIGAIGSFKFPTFNAQGAKVTATVNFNTVTGANGGPAGIPVEMVKR